MHGHDPYTYLIDLLPRLPTQRTREIGPLLPVTTGSKGSRLCENTAEQFKTCGLKQYASIVDFHDRQSASPQSE